mgnify:FL=1
MIEYRTVEGDINMKQYALIPMTDSGIYYNGKPLFDILKDGYPELAARELDRIKILSLINPVDNLPKKIRNQYIDFNITTSDKFVENKVPEYLLACSIDGKFREILTKGEITADNENFLKVRFVGAESAIRYYNHTSYEDKVSNLFKMNVKPFEFYEKTAKVVDFRKAYEKHGFHRK